MYCLTRFVCLRICWGHSIQNPHVCRSLCSSALAACAHEQHRRGEACHQLQRFHGIDGYMRRETEFAQKIISSEFEPNKQINKQKNFQFE
jgi:hypothetical protein